MFIQANGEALTAALWPHADGTAGERFVRWSLRGSLAVTLENDTFKVASTLKRGTRGAVQSRGSS